MTEPFRMKNPPIFEVVCGFIFNPMMIASPYILNDYIQSLIQKGFENPRIVPPANEGQEGISIQVGMPNISSNLPFRLLIENKANGFLIQLQHDRFYFNWKKVSPGSPYPSFSGRGDKEGIQAIAIREFKDFQTHIERATGLPLQCSRIDLAKFDHFDRKLTPDSLKELARLIPMLLPLASIQNPGAEGETNNCNINIGFNEVDGNSRARLGLISAFFAPTPPNPFTNPIPIYRLETIVNTDVSGLGDLESILIKNNSKIRELFFALLHRESAIEAFGIDE